METNKQSKLLQILLLQMVSKILAEKKLDTAIEFRTNIVHMGSNSK